MVESIPLKFNKTRLAPTPSGYLHLGNALSFALTAALAKKTQAKILLRIDDLDQARVQKAYLQDIFVTLDFLEIPYNEGPANVQDFERNWSQLHRMELYRTALDQLRQTDAVFACACSRSQIQQQSVSASYPGNCYSQNIELDKPDTCWRFKISNTSIQNIKMWPADIKKEELPPAMRHFVVRKKNGYPAYQLASVCDDEYYGVDLIVRGQDLWTSTLAQMQLAITLNANHYGNSTFYHHALLIAPDGSKLSKSAGDTSIQYLRSTGHTPADIYTAIAYNLGIKEVVKNWEELGKLLLNS